MLSVVQMVTARHAHVCQTILDHHQIVAQNVWLTLIAHLIDRVLQKSAEILAKAHVVLILSVVYKTVFRFVLVDKVFLEIHLLNVRKLLSNVHVHLIHVIHRHVALMRYVILAYANALRLTSVTHILGVAQNVQ